MTSQEDRRTLEAMRAMAEMQAGPAAVFDALRRGALSALLGGVLCGALACAWISAHPRDWRAVSILAVEAEEGFDAAAAARLSMSAEALRRGLAVLPAAERETLAREGAAGQGAGAPDPALRGLALRVAATPSRDGAALALVAAAPDPRRAERLADAVVAGLLSLREEETRRRAARGLDWIEARLDHVMGRLAAAPARGASEEEVATLSSMRAALSDLLAESARAAAGEGPGLRVQRAAEADPRPDGPRALTVTLIAAALGATLFMLIHRMQDRLRGMPDMPGDIARESGLPVLAAIAPSAAGDAHERARKDPGGREAEAARALRASLLRAAEARAARRRLSAGPGAAGPEGLAVAVTGFGRRHGAGQVAALVAEAFALSGRSTCLLDADLRAPEQARRYGLEGEADLIAALDGDVPLDRALWPADLPDLTVAPSAQASASRAGLLAGPAAAELLDALRSRFDIVVIAAPSPGASSDGQVLCGLADSCLPVFRWGGAARATLRGAAQALRIAGANPAGAALTCATGPARPQAEAWGRGRFGAFAESFAE